MPRFRNGGGKPPFLTCSVYSCVFLLCVFVALREKFPLHSGRAQVAFSSSAKIKLSCTRLVNILVTSAPTTPPQWRHESLNRRTPTTTTPVHHLGGTIRMHPRVNRNHFLRRSLSICAVLSASCLPILAEGIDNVVVRKNVSQSNREELARRLRTITGWTDLAFNSDGALRTRNGGPRNGSQSARDLLRRAFAGKRIILFEDASSRKDVVFCRVVLGTMDQVTSSEVYVVLIDFADFRQVTGDKQALAAFDVGWAVLHEIDHVVEDSQDPQEDVVGDCEDHINRMRRELGLPVRNSYFFSFLPLRNNGNLVSRFVRLGFDQDAAPSSKRKRYWLIWDAAVVGGLTSDERVARVSCDIS